MFKKKKLKTEIDNHDLPNQCQQLGDLIPPACPVCPGSPPAFRCPKDLTWEALMTDAPSAGSLWCIKLYSELLLKCWDPHRISQGELRHLWRKLISTTYSISLYPQLIAIRDGRNVDGPGNELFTTIHSICIPGDAAPICLSSPAPFFQYVCVTLGDTHFLSHLEMRQFLQCGVLLTYHCWSSDKSNGDCCWWCQDLYLNSPLGCLRTTATLHLHLPLLIQSSPQVHPLNHRGRGGSLLFPGLYKSFCFFAY